MHFLPDAGDDGEVLREVVSQDPGHARIVPAAFFFLLVSFCLKLLWLVVRADIYNLFYLKW